ncbi:MAG: DMT family transporter [Desulfobacteraceae bacterium]|nr:MAG: DMT family transporter [Desulfobacteraceae bacterium]
MNLINSKFREYGADASLLFISIIWGSTFIITKQAIENVQVFSFLTLRFALASLLLWIISSSKIKRLSLKTVSDGSILGAVLFLTYAFQTVGLKYTSASVTAFITGLYVVIVPILSLIILNKKPGSHLLVGVLLSFTGLSLITLTGKIALSRGEVLVLANALFASFHIVLTDHYSRRNDIFLLTAVQISVVLCFSLLTSLIFEKNILPGSCSNQLIFALLLTGIFATVVAFLIQTGLQKYTTPTKAAVIYGMEPVSSAFFSYFIGAELLTLRQYTGAMIIIFAMIFVETGSYYRSRSYGA